MDAACRLLPDALDEADAIVCIAANGRRVRQPPPPLALLPGSFNPLHEGHRQLAAAAADLLGRAVDFELSLLNVDKPPLTSAEIQLRRAQFAGWASLWLTHAPTFRAKADLFPGSVFVVGADTAVRLIDPRYYGGDPAGVTAALEHIASRGCRFLVAGRCDSAGRFLSLDDVPVPPRWAELFSPIAAARFRLDVSSTQLRARGDKCAGKYKFVKNSTPS